MNRVMNCILLTGVLMLAGVSAAEAGARDLKKVEELVDLMRIEQSVTAAVAQMLASLFATTPEFDLHQDIVLDYTEEHVGWKALKPEVVNLYAGMFSDDEIAELIRFYNSKVGKKTLDVAPAMTERMQAIVQTKFESELDILELRMKNREWQVFTEQEAFANPDAATDKGKK